MINEDLREIFEEADPNFEKIIKVLAENFGKDATLDTIHNAYIETKLPAKTINGVKYLAGYKGPHKISDGWHQATLLDVVCGPKSSCKLMFAANGRFIYETLLDFSTNSVISYTKRIGKLYSILVISEKIENTGEYHAVVTESKPEEY